VTRFHWGAIGISFGVLCAAWFVSGQTARGQDMLAEATQEAEPSGVYHQTAGNSPDIGMNAYSGNHSGNGNVSGCQNCNGCDDGCCDGCGSNCGCNDCGCSNGGCCWPKWYVQGGAMFLWRNNGAVNQPVVESNIDQSTLLDTHSADFDTGIGPRILIGMRTSANEAWMVQYFSAFDFDGNSSITVPGGLAAPGSLGQTGTDWSFADQMSIHYTSEINNFEINHMRTWGNWSFLAGFRFLDLNEDYDITSISGADTSFYNVHTRNDLFGAQLGGRYRQCYGRFFWDFTGKAGVYGNAAQQTQLLTDNDNTTVDRDSISHKGTVAFVGDLNLSVGFQLNCVWAFRCGYNLMWIDEVALAPDQLDFDVSSAGTGIHTGGDVFLQGINVGLEGHW
jgi:hypothetical protein